jgi:hypothetical protein
MIDEAGTPPPLAPARGMPEAINLTFIAAPLTGNQLKELIQIPPRRK